MVSKNASSCRISWTSVSRSSARLSASALRRCCRVIAPPPPAVDDAPWEEACLPAAADLSTAAAAAFPFEDLCCLCTGHPFRGWASFPQSKHGAAAEAAAGAGGGGRRPSGACPGAGPSWPWGALKPFDGALSG
ncbi:unnamed protein product, partial [Heterosigma akashiwo]